MTVGRYSQTRTRRDTQPPMEPTGSGPINVGPPEPSESIRDALDELVRKGSSIKTVAVWAIGMITTVFTAGIGWAVFYGEQATDAEVYRAVHDAISDHNGGSHPSEIDAATKRPIGHHPEIHEALREHGAAITQIQEEVLPRIEETQRRLDKRSEYQFELGRWQASVTEAERLRRRPPPKPDDLIRLERDLMFGKFEE